MSPAPEARPPRDDAELKRWLQSMVWYHHFSDEEISNALGLTLVQVMQARSRFDINPNNRPKRAADSPVHVLPYPGGRHPRIQFLDGAVDPQRETKVSIFTPWDETSYVVADVPEALWSNLGLTYLAHTHVPTVWTRQGVKLERLEWEHRPGSVLELERKLPNGIRFGTRVTPRRDHVFMEQWLHNGTGDRLTDLRVQNCVMLKGANGFEQLTNENKEFRSPYGICRDAERKRAIVTGWWPIHRVWANPPCPCLHADPKFPDCEPGRTVGLRGILFFHEGDGLDAAIQRIEATGWRQGPDGRC